jgi:hypothetical protein
LRAGFPHSDTLGSMLICQLPETFRRLSRLSSPVIAKASTTCTYSLDPITIRAPSFSSQGTELRGQNASSIHSPSRYFPTTAKTRNHYALGNSRLRAAHPTKNALRQIQSNPSIGLSIHPRHNLSPWIHLESDRFTSSVLLKSNRSCRSRPTEARRQQTGETAFSVLCLLTSVF